NEQKEDGHYLRREFSYTQYHQTLLLPEDVDRDRIEATVNHGVLTVRLPKLTPQEVKRESRAIDIK
ncbi:MAG: Hsp20/alpha crystallin family protein, partial [Muribaculaceae bacterium]|nr:Hsp20/alpha crystallin family protein [Muribaculaceae bacterium]